MLDALRRTDARQARVVVAKDSLFEAVRVAAMVQKTTRAQQLQGIQSISTPYRAVPFMDMLSNAAVVQMSAPDFIDHRHWIACGVRAPPEVGKVRRIDTHTDDILPIAHHVHQTAHLLVVISYASTAAKLHAPC